VENKSEGRDTVFATTANRASDFQFNEQVAVIFDDMLVRSVPFYLEQQSLIQEIASQFYQKGTRVIDLGCSTATTLINIGKAISPTPSLVGYDSSEPMLEKARANIKDAGLAEHTELLFGDFNDKLDEVDLSNTSLVTLCWTLQFVRPLKRDALIRKIYNGMKDGGALIVTEKTLTNDSNMNRFFIDFYYDFKRRNGYSDEEISKKREALENVLIPYRFDENFELFRRNGFQIVETFFQWYNFAGFLCVKSAGE